MDTGDTTVGIARRDALAATLAGVGTLAWASGALAQSGDTGTSGTGRVGPKPVEIPGWNEQKGQFELPALPYDAKALEPHIDAQTMQIHHDKHHASYVAGLNKALNELERIRDGQGDASLIKHWSREVSFHGSGHVNHTLFWMMMAPPGKGGGGEPKGSLMQAIERDFGSFDRFVAHFKAAANAVEGGGWAWLVVDGLSGRLMVIQEEKQQDMMLTGASPILGIDVWEHAYYLKYQNKRSDYVSAWFNVVNWQFCQGLFDRATSGRG